MRADELIELFGDTVTMLTGNPYTGKQLSTDEIDRIMDRIMMSVCEKLNAEEKARESDPAR